jgi:hypothetical protein
MEMKNYSLFFSNKGKIALLDGAEIGWHMSSSGDMEMKLAVHSII